MRVIRPGVLEEDKNSGCASRLSWASLVTSAVLEYRVEPAHAVLLVSGGFGGDHAALVGLIVRGNEHVSRYLAHGLLPLG
jgi:hypothetical protein